MHYSVLPSTITYVTLLTYLLKNFSFTVLRWHCTCLQRMHYHILPSTTTYYPLHCTCYTLHPTPWCLLCCHKCDLQRPYRDAPSSHPSPPFPVTASSLTQRTVGDRCCSVCKTANCTGELLTCQSCRFDLAAFLQLLNSSSCVFYVQMYHIDWTNIRFFVTRSFIYDYTYFYHWLNRPEPSQAASHLRSRRG